MKPAKLQPKPTSRGFLRAEFKDQYGFECLIQESSITTPCIWLGVNDPHAQEFIAGQGWSPYPLPENVLCHTRMHLTQKQAKALLPLLEQFVRTGRLAA